MSLTLGEKLRQAREARGTTIAEVAEQTRISPLYLESIENDDYRNLPGGIFNKGFVKSFAKFVGMDEQEALQDYNRLMSAQNVPLVEEHKVYKPEVLTDERTNSSSLTTIIFAVIILGLMTWGILTLVNYLQSEQNKPIANNNVNKPNTTSNAMANTNSNISTNANVSPPLPSTNEISAEFTVTEDVAATVVADGKKDYPTWTSAAPVTVKANESLRITYSKSKAQVIQMTLNGKPVTLPNQAKSGIIVFEINKDNLAQILQTGQFPDATSMANTAANTNTNAAR